MRELARINRITKKLNDLWHYYPDMRYIQFLQLVLSNLPESTKKIDMFFLEDYELESTIDKMLGEMNDKDVD